MVTNGVLPIDQLKEHTGPVALISQRIPRKVLEKVYGIKIRMKNLEGLDEEDDARLPTAEEVLCSYAGKFHLSFLFFLFINSCSWLYEIISRKSI